MRSDSRLSSVLHVLLHMAELRKPITSEMLAAHLGANQVQIRRTMAGLREAGFVRSEKGHGGGWTIACDLAGVTMGDVYQAIGAPRLFALGHRSQDPDCLVEQAVNAALGETLDSAEKMLLKRLGRISLADLSADFHARAAARGHFQSEKL